MSVAKRIKNDVINIWKSEKGIRLKAVYIRENSIGFEFIILFSIKHFTCQRLFRFEFMFMFFSFSHGVCSKFNCKLIHLCMAKWSRSSSHKPNDIRLKSIIQFSHLIFRFKACVCQNANAMCVDETGERKKRNNSLNEQMCGVACEN